MQFITGLFGGSDNAVLTMILALAIVLVLIVLGVWLLKLVFNASGTAVRGRNRRLTVTDMLALDQKRQLLIVRRDDVEHLILIGGPQDLVVETGIKAPETPMRKPAGPLRRPADPAVTASLTPIEPSRPRTRSLRHTGLLRPAATPETAETGQNPDISSELPADSAKEGEDQGTREGAGLAHDTGTQTDRS